MKLQRLANLVKYYYTQANPTSVPKVIDGDTSHIKCQSIYSMKSKFDINKSKRICGCLQLQIMLKSNHLISTAASKVIKMGSGPLGTLD